MLYTKLRIDFKYAKKGRFYRVVLIRDNPTLELLGQSLVIALGGELEHAFLYRDKNEVYILEDWINEWGKGCAIESAHFNDLLDDFEFDYDTGDGWEFKCKKYANKVELDNDQLVIVVEAKGMGIWEDNIGSLYAYLEGEIDEDFNGVDEERGIYKPWNHFIDKYSDFDKPVDLDELNEKIKHSAYSGDMEEEYANTEKGYNTNLKRALINIVNEQAMMFDFVGKKLEELSDKYGRAKAQEMIAAVLATHIWEMETQHHDFDLNKYIKDVKVLR